MEVLDDGGGDRAEGPLSRTDVVCGTGYVAESVGGAGDGEVVHFVVHDDAGGGDDELGAEEQVYGAGYGDGHSGAVGGGDVGCAVAV